MNWTFDVARIRGIRIRIHYLFPVILGGLVIRQGMYDLRQNTFTAPGLLVFLVLLFAFVLIHELGHALMALRCRVPVIDITLWPFCGIARLGKLPETPGVELAVAGAGPAVNVLFAVLLLPAFAIDPGLWDELRELPPQSVIAQCFLVNALMAGFNCIPAFPLDGGRLLRATLGYRLSYAQATRLTAGVGVVIGLAFMALGIVRRDLAVLSLLGVFMAVLSFHEARSVTKAAAVSE